MAMPEGKRSLMAISRRRFVADSAGTLVAGAALLGFPAIVRARTPIKIGLVHPVTGFLAYSGGQCRAGALMAIDEINRAGGIHSLGGVRLEPILGDARSRPDVGASEVEKMNEAGVVAIVGAYASSIGLATTQRAAHHGIPHVVDVCVADQIVNRGLTNIFRFCPGYGTVVRTAVENLVKINDAAGRPARTAMIVHEESLFGTGTAKLLSAELPKVGFEVLEVIRHPNPARDFNNIVLKIRAQRPDIVIPANYYNEYILLARTMSQYRVQPMAIYSVLGGTASSYQFLKDFPRTARYIMDCNHWYDPENQAALDLRRKVRENGLFFTYELFLAYTATKLLADALERAASDDRAEIIRTLKASDWGDHFMPYGPTKFVNGQNQGARPLNTQILGNEIEVIYPAEYATADAIFPVPVGG
jgi:branched-chain amino acid transport system substrate-binding protein